jgi:hypothetical protein
MCDFCLSNTDSPSYFPSLSSLHNLYGLGEIDLSPSQIKDKSIYQPCPLCELHLISHNHTKASIQSLDFCWNVGKTLFLGGLLRVQELAWELAAIFPLQRRSSPGWREQPRTDPIMEDHNRIRITWLVPSIWACPASSGKWVSRFALLLNQFYQNLSLLTERTPMITTTITNILLIVPVYSSPFFHHCHCAMWFTMCLSQTEQDTMCKTGSWCMVLLAIALVHGME